MITEATKVIVDESEMDSVLSVNFLSVMEEDMSGKSKSYMLRMSEPLSDRFEALCREFDLAPATLLKLLLQDQLLEKDLDAQIEIVVNQLRRCGSVKSKGQADSSSRNSDRLTNRNK